MRLITDAKCTRACAQLNALETTRRRGGQTFVVGNQPTNERTNTHTLTHMRTYRTYTNVHAHMPACTMPTREEMCAGCARAHRTFIGCIQPTGGCAPCASRSGSVATLYRSHRAAAAAAAEQLTANRKHAGQGAAKQRHTTYTMHTFTHTHTWHGIAPHRTAVTPSHAVNASINTLYLVCDCGRLHAHTFISIIQWVTNNDNQ